MVVMNGEVVKKGSNLGGGKDEPTNGEGPSNKKREKFTKAQRKHKSVQTYTKI